MKENNNFQGRCLLSNKRISEDSNTVLLCYLLPNSSCIWDDGTLAEYLRQFQLDPAILRKDFSSLSGGEKQRVMLIAGLLMNRNVFLLDEITASLDVELRKQVVDLFASRGDWTVLAVSHDAVWNTRPEYKTIPVGEEI